MIAPRVGLPLLAESPKLKNLAGTWAWHMAVTNSLNHQDLGGLLRSPDYSVFHRLSETIIVEPYDVGPAQTEDDRMNSPPHRATILSARFTVVGIGVFRGADGRVWAVADFGAP